MKQLSVFFLGVMALCLTPQVGAANDKPNVILIVSDDAGYSDIGAFGSEIDTPNIDRLAYEGVRFSQFYSNARCSQTRASLLTGQYSHSVGVGDLANGPLRTNLPGYLGYLNPENNRTLAEILKDNGYQTIMSGKWHLGGYPILGRPLRNTTSPLGRGFDTFFGLLHGETSYTDTKLYVTGNRKYEHESDKPFYATDAFVDFAMQTIADTRDATETPPPFFLYLPFTAPHAPLAAPQDLIEKYQSTYGTDWSQKRWQRLRRERYDRAVAEGVIDRNTRLRDDSFLPGQLPEILKELPIHAAMMERMDQNIGFLMNYLDRINELENSIIIYMSDNGGSGPYHLIGNTPFHGRKAVLWEGGMRTHFLFWSPKHVRTSGRIAKETVHVIDVIPTLLDLLDMEGGVALDGKSFAPVLNEQKWDPDRVLFWEVYGAQAVRKDNWKYFKDEYGKEHLFDISRDPTETKNRADAFPDIVSELKGLYEEWAENNNVLPYETVKKSQPKFRRKD